MGNGERDQRWLEEVLNALQAESDDNFAHAEAAEQERDEAGSALGDAEAGRVAAEQSLREAQEALGELVRAISIPHGKRSESEHIRQVTKRAEVTKALVVARAVLDRLSTEGGTDG